MPGLAALWCERERVAARRNVLVGESFLNLATGESFPMTVTDLAELVARSGLRTAVVSRAGRSATRLGDLASTIPRPRSNVAGRRIDIVRRPSLGARFVACCERADKPHVPVVTGPSPHPDAAAML